jgi:CheY-specific phosphatase CheX
MSTSKVSLPQWRTAVEAAAREIASYALSFPGATVQDPVGLECAISMIGAHIPLIGGGVAYDFGLVSSAEGCQNLARAILYRAAGAPVTDAEMADAIGEIVNMMGGAVKRRLASQRAELELGLPIFIHGYMQPTEKLAIIALPTRFGTIDTIVMIAGPRG